MEPEEKTRQHTFTAGKFYLTPASSCAALTMGTSQYNSPLEATVYSNRMHLK